MGISISMVSPDLQGRELLHALDQGLHLLSRLIRPPCYHKIFQRDIQDPSLLDLGLEARAPFRYGPSRGSDASSASTPQASNAAAEKASESEVFESIPSTKAALSEK